MKWNFYFSVLTEETYGDFEVFNDRDEMFVREYIVLHFATIRFN